MKFLHITDTHLMPSGEQLRGLDPEARLVPLFDDINRFHADAQCCVITGDLADTGSAGAYQILHREIERCRVPCHLLLGNHDRRDLLTAQFPAMPTDENGFVQYAVQTPVGVFLMLDTVKAGAHSGQYCEDRCQWLESQLRHYAEQPIFLFMHHPPFDIHIPALDVIGLADKQAFAQVISPHQQRIRHLFFGHVHRAVSGNWMGISYNSLRGTNHQVQFDLQSTTLKYNDEPSEYGIIFVGVDQIVVHTHQYQQPS